ncbi:MAG TPA: DNA-binding protein, partial [Deltaproteobacteria bacterium]|nr:DNA-binding protein [Deltaproteobacteria bacterium]
MATLTLKNLPSRLHEKLKKRALQNHRSLNREVISCLETSLGSQKVDVEAFLFKVRKL